MAQNNWEMDFEYDWVIKKRQKDELAKLKLNPNLTTGQITLQKTSRQQQNNNTQRMHSTDARTQKLLPDDNEKQQADIDLIKEQAKKRRKEKLKVILSQVNSQQPPLSQEELNQIKK